MTEQLQGALNSRIVVEQAKGVMSALRGVSPDEAFVLLRTHARDQRLRLSDVALAVLTDPTSVPALTTRL